MRIRMETNQKMKKGFDLKKNKTEKKNCLTNITEEIIVLFNFCGKISIKKQGRIVSRSGIGNIK